MAVKRNAFARGFKSQARAPEDLADQCERLLAAHALKLLGLMRKSGDIALGASQVESALKADHRRIRIEASDGAADGREKLDALQIGLNGGPGPVAGCFTATELGMALGRDRVVHACLLQERLAHRWAIEIGRLSGFRAVAPCSWPQSWAFLLGISDPNADLASEREQGFVGVVLDEQRGADSQDGAGDCAPLAHGERIGRASEKRRAGAAHFERPEKTTT